MRRRNPIVSVVGATGMVGREMLRLLEERRFPIREARFFSSGAVKKHVTFKGRKYPAPAMSMADLMRSDIVFSIVEEDIAKRFAPALAKAGIWTIDDSSAFRMDPRVPLVIPEINSSAITPETRLISGPNCTAAALLMGISPIHRANRITRIRAATYQAVSGAGRAAMEELEEQLMRWCRKKPQKPPQHLPQQIALNLFPHVGSFNREGCTGEETKIANETRKILGDSRIRVSVTAARVPVLRGHSLAVWLETERRITPCKARSLLRKAPGVKLLSREPTRYPTPLMAALKWPTFVGRIRATENSPHEIAMWIVSDNLLKGAALNSIQIAEFLLRKGWV